MSQTLPNATGITSFISYSNLFTDEHSEVQSCRSGNPTQAVLTPLLVQLLISLSSLTSFSEPRDPGN